MSGLTAVSLFAGIGGIDLALERAGIRVVAAVEIDPACRAVLARHFREAKLFDDVCEVTGDDLIAAGFVPGRGVLAFGWPCQDISVAGLRAGLGGARSGLFWQAMRLAAELRPRWLLAENVDGLLSACCSCPGDDTCTESGRAVACGRWETRAGKRTWLDHVTHAPAGGACPGGCMGTHGGALGTVLGAVAERGYGFAYRVLDAQFAGVPQRRERFFLVADSRDWGAPAEILLEPESSPRHPAEGAQAGTRVAGTLAASAGSGGLGGAGQSASAITSRFVETASTLQGGGRRGHRIDAEGAAGGHLIPFDTAQITSSENRSNPRPGDPAPTLNGTGQIHVAPFPSRDVTHTITSREGKGADSDATSGFIVQPVALRGRDDGGQIEYGEPGHPAFTLRTPRGGGSYPMIAHALTSEGADASEDGTGTGTPLVVAATLTSGRAAGDDVNDPGRRSEDDVNLVPMAFNPQAGGSKDHLAYGEKPSALQASQVTGVQSGAAVRRLTPLECERLQGLPDDWTRWLADGTEQSDSARYREIGNSVAVPCVQWIAERLAAYARSPASGLPLPAEIEGAA